MRERAPERFSAMFEIFLMVDSKRFCVAPKSARIPLTVEIAPSIAVIAVAAAAAVLTEEALIPRVVASVSAIVILIF